MTTTWSTPEAEAPDALAGRTPLLSRRRGVAAGLLGLLLIGGVGLAGYGAGRGHAQQQPEAGLVPLPPAAAAGPHVTAGVPVGYPHDEAGARSAAANYVVAYGSAAMLVPEQRTAILTAILDPERSATLRTQLDAGLPIAGKLLGLNEQGEPLQPGVRHVERAFPIGVRTLAYSPDNALIAVWANFLEGLSGSASTRPVTEGWATLSVTLRWVAGDWKWATWSSADGPVPVSGVQQPSDGRVIADATDGFGGLIYASRD